MKTSIGGNLKYEICFLDSVHISSDDYYKLKIISKTDYVWYLERVRILRK